MKKQHTHTHTPTDNTIETSDSDMAQMLKLSDREFKVTMINVLPTLKQKK